MTSPLTPRQVAAVLAYAKALHAKKLGDEHSIAKYGWWASGDECMRTLLALQDALLADEPKPAAKRGKTR